MHTHTYTLTPKRYYNIVTTLQTLYPNCTLVPSPHALHLRASDTAPETTIPPETTHPLVELAHIISGLWGVTRGKQAQHLPHPASSQNGSR